MVDLVQIKACEGSTFNQKVIDSNCLDYFVLWLFQEKQKKSPSSFITRFLKAPVT